MFVSGTAGGSGGNDGPGLWAGGFAGGDGGSVGAAGGAGRKKVMSSSSESHTGVQGIVEGLQTSRSGTGRGAGVSSTSACEQYTIKKHLSVCVPLEAR